MTRAELLEAAGIDADRLAELEDYGLIRRSGPHYGPDALEVARACAALAKFGVAARNLRGIKAAAERDISLAEQLVTPQLRQRGAGRAGGGGPGRLADRHAEPVAARCAGRIRSRRSGARGWCHRPASGPAGRCSSPPGGRCRGWAALGLESIAGVP